MPCLVVDPFNGAGTSGLVAVGLGRRYIGIDLSPKYVEMSRRRLEGPLFARRPAEPTAQPAASEQQPLFGEGT